MAQAQVLRAVERLPSPLSPSGLLLIALLPGFLSCSEKKLEEAGMAGNRIEIHKIHVHPSPENDHIWNKTPTYN